MGGMVQAGRCRFVLFLATCRARSRATDAPPPPQAPGAAALGALP
eukprot:CAMPEP_0172633036 /NCGR_PEP_ID=MMETSP1068-20121228/187382_1 /TAXON_ID=35684 /ORGANISM="Pseudopedinella elastica, Strain CCMP716" /LENGTH=44 /DNA_ID= /DNA_START= /DNA_END= /DNA_ORIENTATION=